MLTINLINSLKVDMIWTAKHKYGTYLDAPKSLFCSVGRGYLKWNARCLEGKGLTPLLLPSVNLQKGDFSSWKFMLRQHPTPEYQTRDRGILFSDSVVLGNF